MFKLNRPDASQHSGCGLDGLAVAIFIICSTNTLTRAVNSSDVCATEAALSILFTRSSSSLGLHLRCSVNSVQEYQEEGGRGGWMAGWRKGEMDGGRGGGMSEWMDGKRDGCREGGTAGGRDGWMDGAERSYLQRAGVCCFKCINVKNSFYQLILTLLS